MAAETRQGNGNLAAIVFAAFALACIVAFLAYRGSDIVRLPQLVGGVAAGSLLGGDIWRNFLGAFAGLLVYFAWYGTGSGLLRTLFSKVDFGSGWTFMGASAALGAAVWSFLWFLLGLADLYRPWVALAATLLVSGLSAVVGLRLGPAAYKNSDEPISRAVKVLSSFVLIVIAFGIISAMAPPIAKDTLLYHLSLPKLFVAQQSIGFADGNIASYLALGTEMHSVWAMLLAAFFGGSQPVAAGVAIFMFLPPLVETIYGWAREIGTSRIWALIATLIVATIPTAYHVASSGYIDLSLALYVTLATYSLTRWWKQQTWGWVVLMAVFLGAALSVKLTAVFVFAAFAMIILLRARGSKDTQASSPRSHSAGRIALTGFAALLLAGVIASPWYIRTWVVTGSPVFPFYMSIWPGKAEGWDVERSNLFQAMNSQYGGADVNKLNYLTAPVRVSVAAQPEQPANYDGVLGPAFLIGLPLLIFALWKLDLGVEVKIMAGVAGIIYLFWLFSSEQLRYLLPIVPMLAIAIAAAAQKIGGRVATVAQYSLIAASICGLLTSFAWFCQKAPLRVVLGGETREEYLTRNLDYYPYYQTIHSETPADVRVWLINMRRDTYHLERPVLSDYLFEDWTLRKMLWDSRNVQELKAKTAAMGVDYVLTRHDFLFDYDRSTLVDDQKPRAENEAKLSMAREFILDPANTIKADAKFSLIKVFTQK